MWMGTILPAMNESKRAALAAQIAAIRAPAPSMPVVSLDAFFDGNDDAASIGCNLMEHPGVRRFHEVLAAIVSRSDVQDVLVGISDPMTGERAWPFADTVYVVTSAPAASVSQWVAELQPDTVTDGVLEVLVTGLPAPRPDMRPVRIWWD
jgi:hypothetical protein